MPNNNLLTLGWREWVELPDLQLPFVKAKVDSGARTSALHAFSVNPFVRDNIQYVEFLLHPHQRDNDTVMHCVSEVKDRRNVTDSGGHTEERWVVETSLLIGDRSWPIDVTLTSRDNMRFRMLLGRQALNNHAVINPAQSYLIGKKPPRQSRSALVCC